MASRLILATALATLAIVDAEAAPIYLNDTNISVAVGPNTSPGSFNNTFVGGTIDKVIDAPSADAIEFHNQTTHIWFTADQVGGGLELLFDFGQEFSLNTIHVWNYFSEGFDIDNIDFTFFDSSNTEVGALSITPALGSSGGIAAQDFALPSPLDVQFVTSFLTGTNRQTDFQNIGFSAETLEEPAPLPVPEASTTSLALTGLMGIFLLYRRRTI